MDDQDEAIRRALREVAATTAAADEPPPDLAAPLVPADPRRSWLGRGERLVLGAVAAAILLVAGVLVVVAAGDGDGDGDEVVSGPDDGTTTTDTPAPTTIVAPSTTETTMAVTPMPTKHGTSTTAPAATIPPARQAATLATGDGWAVVREGRDESACIVLVSGGATNRHCGLKRSPVPGPVWSTTLPNGGTLRVVAAGDAERFELFARSGIHGGEHPTTPDPFITRLTYAVSEGDDVMVMRRGDDIRGAVYDTTVVTAPIFEPHPGYRRTSGSLSLGLFQEIGAYGENGSRCVLARQITPDPKLLADHCSAGAPTVVSTVLVPTTEPMLLDLFGLAPLTEAEEWSCELPSGGLCGTGEVVSVPELEMSTISGFGPITVDDNGRRAERVTLVIGDQRVEVPIPPA